MVALTCGAIAGISACWRPSRCGRWRGADDGAGVDGRREHDHRVPAFADGEDARHAAEELIGAYIESEFGVVVTDAACSVPPDGDVGEEFACYALKPGNLVIALRATIGPQRLVELDLLVNQTPTTTTSPARRRRLRR